MRPSHNPNSNCGRPTKKPTALRPGSLPNFSNTVIHHGRIHLHERLGQGTFGAVYRATTLCGIDEITFRIPPGTQLAVKIIRRPENKRDLLFERELEHHTTVSKYDHVLKLYGRIEDSEFQFLLLEYCAGNDLLHHISMHAFGTDDELRRRVVLQLIDGVIACHRAKVYHRDLKPENLFFVDNWNSLVVGDFGLSARGDRATNFGTGSAPYMAPETYARSDRAAKYHGFRNDKVDIWAIAVIIVNIVTGRRPWDRAVVRDHGYRAYLHNPRIFFRSRLAVSRELDDLLQRVFLVDPTRRITLKDMRHTISTMPMLGLSEEELRRSSRKAQHAAATYADLSPVSRRVLSRFYHRDSSGNPLAIPPEPTLAPAAWAKARPTSESDVYHDDTIVWDTVLGAERRLMERPGNRAQFPPAPLSVAATFSESLLQATLIQQRVQRGGPPPLHGVSSQNPLVFPGFDDDEVEYGDEETLWTTETGPVQVYDHHHVVATVMAASSSDIGTTDSDSTGPATPEMNAIEPDVEVPDIDGENAGVDLAGARIPRRHSLRRSLRLSSGKARKTPDDGIHPFKTVMNSLRRIPRMDRWKGSRSVRPEVV